MGLFKFLKNAGSNLFGKKKEAAAAPTVDPEAVKQQRINVLTDMVNGLGLEIENLTLNLEDESSVVVTGEAANNEAREKVILALGNVEGIDCVDDQMTVAESEPEADFYEVKSGDSLSKIAKAYYGDAMKYPVIFEANKPMLKDPNLIYPGQMLRIPKV